MSRPRKQFCVHGHDTHVVGRTPGGNCSECSRIRAREWHYANPGRIRTRNLKRLYGLDDDEYQAMLEAQDGKCFTCGEPPGWTQLCVDHDHETGKVRKLLCHRCNRAIGLAGDNAALLTRMANYLEASA